MKARRKWNVLLGWRELTVVLSLCGGALFAWVLVLAPNLFRVIKPLGDTSPYTHAVLYALIGFSLLPFCLVPPLFALYGYQKRFDRTHSQQAASPNGGPAERFGNSGAGGGPPSVS